MPHQSTCLHYCLTTDLLSQAQSEAWIMDYFHPAGLKCPRCGASVADTYVHRQTKKSNLTVYRCKRCRQIYNLYSGTVFQQCYLTCAISCVRSRACIRRTWRAASPYVNSDAILNASRLLSLLVWLPFTLFTHEPLSNKASN